MFAPPLIPSRLLPGKLLPGKLTPSELGGNLSLDQISRRDFMAKKKKKRVVAKTDVVAEGTSDDESSKGSAKDSSSSPPALASFETSLHELEQIVSELESGNLSLSDSLDKYETGIKNLKICHRILEHAENRIRLLTGVDEDGSARTTDFDGRQTELHQRGYQRTYQAGDTRSGGSAENPAGDKDDVDDSEGLF